MPGVAPPAGSGPRIPRIPPLRLARKFDDMELLHSLLFMLNEMSPYVLLGFLIAGLMHAFVPQRTFARHLSGRGFGTVVKSALIGVPLPLCSCGVLPAAIAMHRNGASKAASTSFLISTPQTGVDSIAATWSLLGPAFAVLRPLAALATAVLGGAAVGRSEKEPAADIRTGEAAGRATGPQSLSGKCREALRYGFVDLAGSIGGWLVAGLIVAALITVYVPADFFSALGDRPLLSMIAVLIIAVPMYVCATGSIPIALSLVAKGLSPGTAFVLLMAGPAANFASFTLIAREMGRRAAVTYLVSIILGAVAFGLAIDYLLPARWFAMGPARIAAGCAHGFSLFPSLCSGLLAVLLGTAIVRRYSRRCSDTHTTAGTEAYTVRGMSCSHCRAAVAASIGAVAGVERVDVDLATGRVTVEGAHDAAAVVAAIRKAGFDVAE